MGRFWATLLMTPTLFFTVARKLEIPVRDILITLVWPIIAGLVMAAVVGGTNSVLPFHGPPRLAIDIALGGLTFISAMMALWFLRGRPNGPEAQLWQRIPASLRP
jgi:hypothetical protein